MPTDLRGRRVTDELAGTTTTVTEYTISAVPKDRRDDPNAYLFDIQVCYAPQMDGTIKWAVRWRGRCLNRAGRWDWEMQPSSRTERWLAGHRFDLDRALRLARIAAPLLTLNGYGPDGTRREVGIG